MRLRLLLTLLIAAGGLAGCSSTGRGLRLTWSDPPAKQPSAETSPAETKSSTPVAERDAKPAESPTKVAEKPAEATPPKSTNAAVAAGSPFQPSRERTASHTADAAGKPTGGDAAKPLTATAVEPSVSPAAGRSLTPDLLRLIDSELADATPEERAEWYENLKRIDAAVIPEVLRARRLSRQVAQQRAGQNEIPPLDETPAAPLIQPVGYRSTAPETTVLQAGYQAPAGQVDLVQQVALKPDPSRQHPAPARNPVQLQGYVIDDSAGNPANASPSPWSTPQAATTSPGVPWPPARSTPAPVAPVKPAGGSGLPFGSGFVQNIAGLVPNRGHQLPATLPATSATPITPVAGQTDLERTINLLEQEVATLTPGPTPETQSNYLRKHVALRQLYLLTNRQERALTAIPGIEPADQEFWQQVFWGMANYLDVQQIPRAEDRATQTIAQMNTAVRRLQERADLQIRNVAFCRQIQYFGNYERFPRDEFRPGQEVLVYAELENFKSEPTADGQYRTLLRSTIELLSPNGELRKQIDFPATEDLCRNYRRDYFHNYQFTIPDRIPLGPHTLKLTVFDELSGKMTSYTLNFLVQ